MSAGPDAKPLGEKGWTDDKGKPISPEKLPSFTCDCGYQGMASELLAEEDNDTLYCPQCTTAAWIWD